MTATLQPYSLALDHPLETATGSLDRREGFLLHRETDGVTGLGEAAPLPGWTESFRECEVALRQARARLDSADEAGARDAVAGSPAASHALDCADVDRRARRADRPMYQYLGAGGRVDGVPVNAVIGDGSVNDTAAKANALINEGYSCLKVKVGAQDPAADLERLQAVRDTVGDTIGIRVDVNGSWTSKIATSLWQDLAELNIRYVEQPLPADDLEGHRMLKNRTGPAIALDESVRELGPETVLDAGTTDVLIVKPMVLGGVERAASLVARAESAGIDPVVTTTVDAAVARATAVHVAATIKDPRACGLATADRLESDIAPDPAPISNGRISVPQQPGHGVTLTDQMDSTRCSG